MNQELRAAGDQLEAACHQPTTLDLKSIVIPPPLEGLRLIGKDAGDSFFEMQLRG
jgi:hypothetical protein